jgi:hypothetical protein
LTSGPCGFLLRDPEDFDFWVLRFLLLDPEVFDFGILRILTSGPWGLGILDPEDKRTTILRNVGVYQSVWSNILEDLNIPVCLTREYWHIVMYLYLQL